MKRITLLQIGLVTPLLVLCHSMGARGQSAISTGSISGQVSDSSGGAIAGATVTATNVARGTARTAKTNGEGFYRFPSLDVGSYSVSVNQSGFKTVEVKDVLVRIGQSVSTNVTLEVGEVAQTVTVEGQASLLQGTESSVSTVVGQELIKDLPLSGRRYTDFVLLTPNASADGQFGLVSIGGQQGGADSGYANGNGSNSFTVDGATASSNYFGEARGRTRVPYVFGEESIQEFQVADNPYNAAYGGGGSGFINAVTKSGGDSFHGGAFYYNRNSGVGKANDAVDKAAGFPRPLDILQQFGANVGGPIVKSKLWFYFDYEQQRRKEPISIVVPGDTGLDETAFGVPSGIALPAPNGPLPGSADFVVPSPFAFGSLTGPQQAEYLQGVSNTLNAINTNLQPRQRYANNLTLFPKLDWQPTNVDHFTFEYNYSKFDSPGGEFTFNPVNFAGDSYLANNFVRDHHATAHWTHVVGATLLNDFRASFTRDDQIATPSGLIPSNLPQISLFSPQFVFLGNANYANANTREDQYQLNERVSYVTGRHSLDFGVDFDYTKISDYYAGNFYGSYSFSNPQSLALGQYRSFSQNVGNPVFPFNVPYYGFYAHDKFRATKSVTIDLGIREDFQVYPQPQANTTLGPVIAQLTGQFPNQYQRFSPRVGVAWQANSKTVVRGGYGMFRQVFNAINYENSVTGNGLRNSSTFQFYNSGAAPNAQFPVFPNPLPASAPVFSSSSNLSIVSPDFKAPYVHEASVEVERELMANTTLTLGTMWTHGTHLIASNAYDLNLCPPEGSANCQPTGTTTYTLPSGQSVTLPNLDAGLLSEGRLIPNYFGQINALISPGNNNYNSFYLRFQQRNFHGLSTLLSYTLAKNTQKGVDFNNQFDLSNTGGTSLLEQRHRLSVAMAYTPHDGPLSNWTVSTAMQFSSGRPYTALLDCSGVFNSVNNSAAIQSTGNTAGGILGSSAPCGPDPFAAYNTFHGPWTAEVDLGLSRSFHVSRTQTIILTAQVFNLLNHPNFFVQAGSGINNSARYAVTGSTCGDGATRTNQQCILVPDTTTGAPAFGIPGEINELNGPRTFQFALRYAF
jgi:hypothetical protein